MTARINRALSQEEVAVLVNCHPMTISKWERGEAKPRGKNLRRLADALEVTIDYLNGEHSSQSGAFTLAHAEWMKTKVQSNASPLELLSETDLMGAAEETEAYVADVEPPLNRKRLIEVLTIVLAEAPSRSADQLATIILTAYDQAVEGKSLDQIREKVRMWFS